MCEFGARIPFEKACGYIYIYTVFIICLKLHICTTMIMIMTMKIMPTTFVVAPYNNDNNVYIHMFIWVNAPVVKDEKGQCFLCRSFGLAS